MPPAGQRGSAGRQTVTIDGHRLRLTHPDKIVYPQTGTTKAEVIQYLVTVAPTLLPHLAGRLVTRKRWVGGVGTAEHPGEVFFEKNLPDSAPQWIERMRVHHQSQSIEYPLITGTADLAWLGQVNALELHVPQWRLDGDQPGNPDRLVLDLDPGPGAGLAECAEVAHEARDLLAEIGLEALPVTSGSKGLHLYAALDGTHDSEYVNAFAKTLAEALAAQLPKLVVSSMSKQRRPGKVLVDWSQNNGNKTTICPYSLRGTALPYVAAPRTWDEIDGDLEQLLFTEVLERLDESDDPLADLVAVEEAAAPVRRGRVEVMLASPGRESAVRKASDWAYEMKWDGIRAVAVVGQGVRLLTRNHHDVTVAYPEVVQALEEAGLDDVVLDGELVAFNDDGAPSFGRLQQRMGLTKPAEVETARKRVEVNYLVFDLLDVGAESWRDEPYTDRREGLDQLELPGVDEDAVVRVPEAFHGELDDAIAESLDRGLEGVIAKRRTSKYRPGRSGSWVKIKHVRTTDVVVCGWIPGRGSRDGSPGSLALGVHREGELSYAGRVGTGFSDHDLIRLAELLGPIEIDEPPVPDVPADAARGVRWVEPRFVGEVTFAEWTDSGQLRHSSWRGLRADVEVSDVKATD